MSVTEPPKVMLAKEVQFWKARCWMCVTDTGIVTKTSWPGVLESWWNNLCQVAGDLHPKTSLCVDVILRCSFYFVPCVCNSHWGFSTHEPCFVKWLSIIYDWAVPKQLHFENFALNGILTRVLLKEHRFQFPNSGCCQNIKGDDASL